VYANVRQKKPADPCKDWGKCIGWTERVQETIFKDGSGKGLVFEKAAQERLEGPSLLGVGANFGGLVMVRSEVGKL